MKSYIEIHPTVKKALEENLPVVALESTIISHGMPYPENIKMANRVEEIIRNEGAVPATIAILNGKIKVGLTPTELEELAKSKDVVKVSKRDFGFVLSQNKTGATTVSATMLIAEMVGIRVFATGGIGGVHRGAEKTFDISRDLEELANVSVAVVCAGAKSILDLGLTLEFLETKGVEVLGYQTKELPAFYSRESGFNLDYAMETPEDIAKLIHAKWNLGLKGGVVIANPIPKAFSMDSNVINSVIDQAILDANQDGIKGKDTTPYLLSKVKEITKGQSLDANLELVYNNAKLAAQIAKNYVMIE
jgi:pseudouridine-5'-phosphate glycosidase